MQNEVSVVRSPPKSCVDVTVDIFRIAHTRKYITDIQISCYLQTYLFLQDTFISLQNSYVSGKYFHDAELCTTSN